MSKNFDETVRHLQSDKSGYKRLEKRDYKGLRRAQVATPRLVGQLVNSVVPRKKRVSGDPLLPDRTGERRQFLSDLPQSLR